MTERVVVRAVGCRGGYGRRWGPATGRRGPATASLFHLQTSSIISSSAPRSARCLAESTVDALTPFGAPTVARMPSRWRTLATHTDEAVGGSIFAVSTGVGGSDGADSAFRDGSSMQAAARERSAMETRSRRFMGSFLREGGG